MFSSVITIPEAILYFVKIQKYTVFLLLVFFFSMCVPKQGCLYPYSLSTTEALLTESNLSAWPLHSLGLIIPRRCLIPASYQIFDEESAVYRFIALTHNGVKSLLPPASFCLLLSHSLLPLEISDCISKNRDLCCLDEYN